MLRRIFARPARIASLACVTLVSSLMASCGGGGGTAAKDMALVEFLLVDRALAPVAATGTDNLPRNAQILMVFSELVNPNSVNNQTIQMRFGPSFQSVPKGSFSVTANTVRFDPTVTADGQPNPFGFDPVTQYTVDIPNFEEQQDVVQNADNDPNLTTFFTVFTTSDGFLRELVPPQITGVGFVPGPDPVTGNIPGDGLMYFDFSEPMAPDSFVRAPFNGPDPAATTIDVRYTTATINAGAGLTTVDTNMNPIGTPVDGSFTPDASATRYFFRPTFSFGDEKFEFFAEVFQGLRDLSGNLLVNPGSYGPFVCDGLGRAPGNVIEENFLTEDDRDLFATDADWNNEVEGAVRGQEITSRTTYVFGYQQADDFGTNIDSGRGQYAPIPDPLTGRNLNDVVSGISPPTSDGRRTMWAFDDSEMGRSGSVTDVAWGPDSNGTFAATYDNVILRMGFQKDTSLSLGTSFTGNYDGSPAVVFNGEYNVSQMGNVGDTPGHPVTMHQGGYQQNPGCTTPANWNSPLYTATGFYSWPALTNFFEWDDGVAGIEGDSVFLFDASVVEGDNWQQIRAWFGSTFPCSGVLIGGFPQRRLYATYEENTANPTENFPLGILNPEPTVMDTCFTVTKRVSFAQSIFYYESGNAIQASNGNTFGENSDYLPAEITPAVQAGGATVEIEFQGATLVEDDQITLIESAPFTEWTRNIDDCDGFPKIRYRLSLISNLVSGEVAEVTQVRIPIVSN